MTASLAIAVIIWYGGGQVVQNTLSFGVLLAFIRYAERFLLAHPRTQRKIYHLPKRHGIFRNASSNCLIPQPTIASAVPKNSAKALKGEIEFRNVWFAYNDDDYVLRDVSFKVKPGEKVALVGHTGAGKTSIINLLCRFYEINKGQILIDGVDIREMNVEELREAISIVQQNIFLFSDSIERKHQFGESVNLIRAGGTRRERCAFRSIHSEDASGLRHRD